MKPGISNSSKAQLLVTSLITGMILYAGGVNTPPSYTWKKETNAHRIFSPGDQETRASLQVTNHLTTRLSRDQDTGVAEIRSIMQSSDCYTCHADNKVLLAPSFFTIADRYKNEKGALHILANKVITGSVGTWGDRPMPPHPELLLQDAHRIIQYILKMNKQKELVKLPVKRN